MEGSADACFVLWVQDEFLFKVKQKVGDIGLILWMNCRDLVNIMRGCNETTTQG